MPVIVASAASSRWHAVPAAVFAAIAVWLSNGALTFRNPSGGRIGVLPLHVVPLAAAALVAVLVFAIGARNPRGAAIAVSPLALLVIPWMPVALPSAFLIWTGALTAPIWIGVALALGAVRMKEGVRARRPVDPRVQMWIALLAGCAVFGLAAWSASAAIPGGDEPHYLVITQSLLHDRDLDVQNNYSQGDYREYYGGPLNPDFRVRGRHGELYSIHAPGVPALVLPAFAVGGYPAVVAFLVLVSAVACALTWWLAWRTTGAVSAAWFGWAVVVFAAPFLLESFTVYPDGPGAAIVLTAFWALRRIDANDRVGGRAWALHGAALALLPWMHTRFVLLAAVLGALIVARLASRRAGVTAIAAFLAVPLVSAVAWLTSFYVMYGTPNPAAAYGGQSDTSIAFLPNGLGGLLFDQGFGLLATAPALAIPFVGFSRMRRFAAEWSVTALAYGVAVGSYAMWWAGTAGPARFLVPVLLPLAMPAAVAWKTAVSRGVRVLMALALALTAWMSAVQAAGNGGFLAYHSRNNYGMTAAPWLGWANRLVDLSQALPAFVPLPDGTPQAARMVAARDGLAATIPWIASLAAAVWLTIRTGRKRDTQTAGVVSVSVAALASATMVAASIVWWMHGGQRVDPLPAQLDVVRLFSGGRALALDLPNLRRVSGLEGLKMRLDVPVDEGARSPAVLASIPLLPSGVYQISTRGTLRESAAIFAGGEDERFPLMNVAPASLARGVKLPLPVMIRALTVRAASGAGAAALELRPYGQSAVVPLRRPAEGIERFFTRDNPIARHAAAYGNTNVFFLDDRTSPEEEGFWIWGAREGRVVFSSASARPIVTFRNGPVQNEVSLRVASDPEQPLVLQPGEERQVSLRPLDGDAYMVTVRTSSGFRPSDIDPRSQDRRYLGVYVAMPEHAVR